MKYLTTREAAAALGISQVRVRQLIETGKLPAEKFGRDWLVTQETVANHVRGLPGRKFVIGGEG